MIVALMWLSGTYAHADSARQYLHMADSFVNLRNYRQAQFFYEQAIRVNPSFEDAKLQFADMLDQRNQYGAARKQLQEVLVSNPNSMRALQALFTDAYRHRLWNDVLDYGKILQQKAPSDSVDEGMAKAHYNKENYGQAIASLKQAVAKKPTASKYVLLAKCQAEVSDYKASAAAFDLALTLVPEESGTWYEYGLVLASVPDYAKAIMAIEKAQQLGIKQTLDFKENLANIYLQTPQYEKGVALINDILVQKPSDDALMFLAAQAYYRDKKYKEAANYFEKAYQTDPENYRALYMLGMSFQRDGKQKKGEAYCDEAISKDPSLMKYKTPTN
jgi:tetratricopeptide (TPR) repeat protein